MNGGVRIVLDCVVFLQALLGEHGPAAEILRQAEAQAFALVSVK
jgi:predicted nucleic acid-binding protein